ncbi:hypothetical protein AX774_g6920, partial [Zancudomyces culisetae]
MNDAIIDTLNSR